MYEERGGNLTRNAHWNRSPCIKTRFGRISKKLFNANQPQGQIIFSSIVRGDSEIFKRALPF